jgi:hypothetical protein
MADIKPISPKPLSPSERLLRELLAMSTRDDGHEISDVIVIWSDNDGFQHMRSANNERVIGGTNG